ncbi:MAG: hypothetical protein LBR66_07225 [Candidatus Symbiothrix sp.]|jgi:hypothetical protein|nr:hypothetical protein [Candidatus Symbiothrix sp.]
MIQAIIYKEWIKTRSVVILLLAIFIAASIYSFMKIAQDARLMGMTAYWESLIEKDAALFPYFTYLPLLAGVLLAITQFVPELQFKRLKLTLHLPLSESTIIWTMLLYGFLTVLALFTLTLPVLMFYISRILPREVVGMSFAQLLPCFLGGLAAYSITAWICLEPQWKQRILNILPAMVLLSCFYISASSGAYCPFVPYLIALTVVALLFSFISTTRFKEGVQ